MTLQRRAKQTCLVLGLLTAVCSGAQAQVILRRGDRFIQYATASQALQRSGAGRNAVWYHVGRGYSVQAPNGLPWTDPRRNRSVSVPRVPSRRAGVRPNWGAWIDRPASRVRNGNRSRSRSAQVPGQAASPSPTPTPTGEPTVLASDGAPERPASGSPTAQEPVLEAVSDTQADAAPQPQAPAVSDCPPIRPTPTPTGVRPAASIPASSTEGPTVVPPAPESRPRSSGPCRMPLPILDDVNRPGDAR